MSGFDWGAAIKDLRSAVENAEWEDGGEEEGVSFWTSLSRGWRLFVGRSEEHSDGTAVKGGVIVHMPPEILVLAEEGIGGTR